MTDTESKAHEPRGTKRHAQELAEQEDPEALHEEDPEALHVEVSYIFPSFERVANRQTLKF